MLEPLNNVLAKYKMLIMKISQDNINVIQARLTFNLLCDLHTLLTLSYLLPLLKVVNILIKFAQGKNIFICNFVTKIKICQANIFMMYFDPFTSYQHEHFQVFVTLWTIVLAPLCKIGLLTSIVVQKLIFSYCWSLLSSSHFLCNRWGQSTCV